jgi:hypothetical protein
MLQPMCDTRISTDPGSPANDPFAAATTTSIRFSIAGHKSQLWIYYITGVKLSLDCSKVATVDTTNVAINYQHSSQQFSAIRPTTQISLWKS